MRLRESHRQCVADLFEPHLEIQRSAPPPFSFLRDLLRSIFFSPLHKALVVFNARRIGVSSVWLLRVFVADAAAAVI